MHFVEPNGVASGPLHNLSVANEVHGKCCEKHY